MIAVLSGAIIMGYVTAGLFFLRFWLRTRDALLLYFSIAFMIFAGQRLALEIVGEQQEHHTIFYVVRLLGFLVIIVGIVDKNRTKKADGA